MSKIAKWSLPALAFALVFGLLSVRAGAEDKAPGAAAAKVKISGVVLMDDGSPAAAAKVRLVLPGAKKSADGGAPEKPAAQAADDAKEGAKPGADADKPGADSEKKPARPEPVAETTTDAAGKFSLEAPAGKYRLMASMKGAGNASKAITLVDGKNQDNVELKLKPMAKKAPAAPAPAPAQ
jgi:hypothetical protein